HYTFSFNATPPTDIHTLSLHDALPISCPCALCDEERATSGRGPGQPVASKPGELPMFKPKVQPISVEPVGKYAMKFNWNDGHQLDRKSTRLNSSHLGISYAVFCLKKKT